MFRCVLAAWLAAAAALPAAGQSLERVPTPEGITLEAPIGAASPRPEALPSQLAESLPIAANSRLEGLEPLSAAPNLAPVVFDRQKLSKSALAVGAAAAVLAPIAYGAVPPLIALHTGWAAAASVAVVSAAASGVPRVSPTTKRAALFGSLLAAGLAVGGLVDGASWNLAAYAALNGLFSAAAFVGASVAAPKIAARLSNDGVGALAGVTGLLVGVAPHHFALPFHAALAVGLSALAVTGAAKFASSAARTAVDWVKNPLPSRRGVAAFALGAALGAWPYAAGGQLARVEEKIVCTAARALTRLPEFKSSVPQALQPLAATLAQGQDFREIGPAFGDEVMWTIQGNPEGRAVLEGLKDRGGALRPPRFFVGRLANGASGFYFPVWDAVIISPRMIEAEDWTVDQFLADPAKQRQLARERDSFVFHELVHAKQHRRRLLFPGQLDSFPSQVGAYLHIEMEYEAKFEEYAYIHEKLRADPHVWLRTEDRIDYELFITDLGDSWGEIDGSPTYRRFVHIKSGEYRDRLGQQEARWPKISAEGFRLLAIRSLPDHPGDAKDYMDRAINRAQEAHLPAPPPL